MAGLIENNINICAVMLKCISFRYAPYNACQFSGLSLQLQGCKHVRMMHTSDYAMTLLHRGELKCLIYVEAYTMSSVAMVPNDI